MSSPVAATSPAAKETSYYANERADVIALLPRPLGRVLDVGCGAGAVGRRVREAGAEEVVGVEPQAEPALHAREVLDVVINGSIESALDDLEGQFDTVLCLDVLEHLVDPGDVLRRLRRLSRTGAHLQVSVPNARHFSLVRDLVLRGTFGYTSWGHRDDTHLRWFTRRDMDHLLTSCGWTLVSRSVPPLGRSRWLHRLTRGCSSEFLVAQFYVTARNAE